MSAVIDRILDKASQLVGDSSGEKKAWSADAYIEAYFQRVTRGHQGWEVWITVPGITQASAPKQAATIKAFTAGSGEPEVIGDSSMSTSTADLRRQVAELERRFGPPQGDPKAFRDAQVRAHAVYEMFGDSAPTALAGERLHEFHARLLKPLQRYCRTFKDADLSKITDVATLTAIGDMVYADATAEARNPTSYLPGQLIPHKIKDASGRESTGYRGDPNACWDQFNPPIRYIRRFLTPGTPRA